MIYDNADTEKIQGFPLDSDITGYYPDGLPIYSNEYKSVKLRRAISSLISDGIIAMKGQEGLKVAIDGSASNFSCSLKAKSGQAVIGGCILSFGNFNDDGYGQTNESTDYVALQNVIVSSPASPGTRYTDIYIGFSEDYTDKSAFIKAVQRSSGTEPQKLYRCLCLATVKSVTSNVSGSYVYSHTVIDLRASSHCGFAAPFVEVDTSMYYDELTNVLNDAWERADESIAELEEKTQVAVELAQDALDENVAGAVYNKLAEFETELDTKQFGTDQIMDAAITGAKLANGAVGKSNLTQEVSDSVSQVPYIYSSEVTNIDNISSILCRSAINPENFPSELGGNRCFVITMYPNATWNAQLAFSFGRDKLAMRRRNGSDWTAWKYLTFS